MVAYYNVLDKLKSVLEADPDINTVTKGSLDDVALEKQTLYSLAHIMINNFTLINGVVTFSISVIVMDIVNEVKEPSDKLDETAFRGIDNEDDVLNTTSYSIVKMLEEFRRGQSNRDGWALNSVSTIEPFTDRFKDKVAGWTVTFSLDVKHDVKIC